MVRWSRISVPQRPLLPAEHFPLAIPPLRERAEDIPLLVRHFTNVCAANDKRIGIIPPEVIEALAPLPVAGQCARVANIIERAVILSHGGVLRPLCRRRSRQSNRLRQAENARGVERGHIIEVLRVTNWLIGGPRGPPCGWG